MGGAEEPPRKTSGSLGEPMQPALTCELVVEWPQ